MGTIFKTENRP